MNWPSILYGDLFLLESVHSQWMSSHKHHKSQAVRSLCQQYIIILWILEVSIFWHYLPSPEHYHKEKERDNLCVFSHSFPSNLRSQNYFDTELLVQLYTYVEVVKVFLCQRFRGPIYIHKVISSAVDVTVFIYLWWPPSKNKAIYPH